MRTSLLLVLPLLACSGDKGAPTDSGGGGGGGPDDTAAGWRPDLVCPGDAGCATNDGELRAGVAAKVVTPPCFEQWEDLDGNGEWDRQQEPFLDCGCDQLCDGDEGWTAADEGEADGEFQAIWLAGFGNSRPANSVHDDLWARAVVLASGDTSVAIVALDVVGFFYDDVLKVRARAAELGADVDLVLVQSSHQHEGPDTLGQWGQRIGKSGVVPEYQAFLIEQAAQAVAEAAASVEPATLYAGVADTAAPFGAKGTWNTVRDSRDPVIIEERLYTARLEAAGGETIATLVNWGNQPEVLSSHNPAITSDFSHYLRVGVEDGVAWGDGTSTAGTGGVCVYVNASVGGLMTPLGITVDTPDGSFADASWEKSEALGKLVAEQALVADAGAVPVTDAAVSIRSAQLFLPVENFAFQAMFLIGVFDREIYNYDDTRDIDEDNVPEVLTEVDLVTVGPITMLSIPGEATPELSIGGYDGSRVNTEEVEFISSSNPNPPDVSAAPEGPYFKDRMGNEHNWIIGLGNDELGYLIPPYDYKLHETSPYLSEAEGDHYEETNSLGPSAVPRLQEMVDKITTWAP
jgi:hypothetical protein